MYAVCVGGCGYPRVQPFDAIKIGGLTIVVQKAFSF